MVSHSIWLALIIGNSRLHWAGFRDAAFCGAWHTPHLSGSSVQHLVNQSFTPSAWNALLPSGIPPLGLPDNQPIELWVASVVPQQSALWRTYPQLQLVDRDRIPLQGIYPTLGIDRILTLWGAGESQGWPVLVIDAGSALTFTAATANHFIGGAILPGLRLQFRSLAQETAALPAIEYSGIDPLPIRWARDTSTAIQSGVIYGLLAVIQDYIIDWRRQFPDGQVLLTGGDSSLLLTCLQSKAPEIANQLKQDPHLMYWGMRAYRRQVSKIANF
ncbi:MAG: pantothenate kinase [Leptolyngbyaceae cyanobacterium MO_188.B28]|nr:pantothenate kinase [Leptolyngbyaceae cyanobacterium MO_188.B28]